MLVVNSHHDIASGDGAPRLYYRVDGSNFTALAPTSSVQDTFYFIIPGVPEGSKVDYYFGVQNLEGTLLATLPEGGRGINPPGNIAPLNFFSYLASQINSLTLCSNTVPKPLIGQASLYDTIFVEPQGVLLDVDVEVDINHTYTGNLEIYLSRPGKSIALSIGNGGSGNNYSGTIFDDEASFPITEGSPPFTGSYQPEEPLSTFDGDEINGYWVLRVFDNSMSYQAALNDWCLHLNYSPMVNIQAYDDQRTMLHQNFPNPFRNETTFSFEIDSPSNVRISLVDMMGRELGDITNRIYSAGEHQLKWNAQNLPQGRYFYRLQTDDHVEVKSMMIIK
jgi:subtilisin-like proprotein convertase family protein